MRFALLAFFLLIGTQIAHAQFIRFQRLGTEQGLGNLAADAIGQDTDGAILVGTEGGLYRFDGASFQTYADPGLASSVWIHQIHVDRAGRLWLSTGDGIFVRHHGALLRVASVHVPDDLISANSMAERDGSMVIDVDGRIDTIPTGSDALAAPQPLFDAPTVAGIPALNHAVFVAADGKRGLLIGCGERICHSSREGVAVLGVNEGLPAETWLTALQAPDGTLWARSLQHLAWRAPGAGSFSVVAVPGEAQSFFAGHRGDIDLVADGHGGILTESEDGLVTWNGHAWRVSPHHAGGLPPNIIHSLFFDREGSLWVGSEGGGVSRSLGLGRWEHWTAEDGLPDNTIWSMAQTPKGETWVATDHGTVELGGRRRRLPGSNYALAVSQAGRLWLAPIGRPLERLDDENAAPETFQPISGDVLNAVVDHDDRVWFSTRSAVAVVDNADAPRASVTSHVVQSGGQFTVAVDPSGTVWAIDQSHLFRQEKGARLIQVAFPGGWTDRATDLTFGRDGTMWIGTETGGVAHFRVDGGTLVALPRLLTPQIASNSILFVRSDSRGWTWVGSDHGIDLLAGPLARRFDSSDGMLTNDLDQESVLEDRDGSMWFGTSAGLSHLLDPAPLAARRELHPRVTSITYGEHAATLGRALETSWTSSPLLIRVDDFDFATGPLTFRYKLAGVDKRWSETSAREIRYANAPPGRLAFEMYAVDAAHGLVSKPVIVAIRIHPPWWRQWWFYVAMWLLGAAVLAVAWWVRIGYLVRQRAQLEELVRCRTAEIEAANDRLARQAALEQRRLEDMVRVRTTEIELAREELQRLALSDALTGLPNRRAVLAELAAWLSTPPEADQGIAALLLDVDHFKQVNDRHGHLAGDEVLAAYGGRLAAAVQSGEMAGRYGGEEFLVVLRGPADRLVARATAIWDAVSARAYSFAGQQKLVTASAGLAILQPDEPDVSLIGRADAALYTAKENGRARLEVAPDVMDIRPGGRDPDHRTSTADLAAQLRDALAANAFTVVFQPIVDIRKHMVTSCEALLRWTSPTLGPVPPDVFIPVAEEIGIMPELGAWVLWRACSEAMSWSSGIGVSVNLSPCQLADATLVDLVASVIAATGLPAHRLTLEVTESAMIGDIQGARRILNELRGLGLSVALDDFGTGFSSLSFLQTLPFDRIKIDKSFVRDLGASSRSLAIVRALVSLCHGLGAKITAEGVETDLQVEMLMAAGCSELQGYLFSRPSAPELVREWMRAFHGKDGSETDDPLSSWRLDHADEFAEPHL